ncbi:uncharacterized protein METZ01_LOCUS478571 [marine metagenome]|uniref:Uncharacterized protein n=1 Tax=marine metagenome TaxID=408172 RepID=A0A383BZW9_9ZZZZ
MGCHELVEVLRQGATLGDLAEDLVAELVVMATERIEQAVADGKFGP